MCYGSLGFCKGLRIRWKILLPCTVPATRELLVSLKIRVLCRLLTGFLLLNLLRRPEGLLHVVSPPWWQKSLPVYDPWLCSASPPPPGISEPTSTGSWQRDWALEPLCAQKRIQAQTEQVDLKMSGFSKGIPLETVPNRGLKAFISFADNLEHIMLFLLS